MANLRRTKPIWKNKKRWRPPKRPPPVGLSIAELAAQAGVTPRTVRYYVECGLLPRAELHGTRTRYRREHLLRLFAIAAMQKERLDLDAIRRRFTTLTDADIEAYAPAAPSPVPVDIAPRPRTYVSDPWDVVQLLPGLTLLVHGGSSPHYEPLVQKIAELCAGSPPSPSPQRASEQQRKPIE
jgi:Ca-activated chloride channel family protein